MSKKTQRERQERLQKQKIMIIGIIIVVLCILFAVVFYVVSNIIKENEISPEGKKIAETSIKQSNEDGKLRDKAREEIKNNDPAKAEDVYAEAADNTADVTRKIELYIDLANVYYDSGKAEEAIKAALKAADFSNDKFLAADWLSRAYEDQKRYAEAIKYYKLAGEWVVSPQNIYNFDKSYYDGEAARVEQLQKGGR